MASFSQAAHWRDSARNARFFLVDARAAFPLLLVLMHLRFWTLGVAFVVMLFFALLERYGFTMPVFNRWIRCVFGGSYKTASPWWRH